MTQSPVNTGQSCWGSRWLLVTAGSPPPGTLPRVTRDTCYSTHPALTWTWIVMGVAGGDVSRDFLTLLLFIFRYRRVTPIRSLIGRRPGDWDTATMNILLGK